MSPELSMELRELPPTRLPLTVSVPDMVVFPPTVRLLADVKLEAGIPKQLRLLRTVADEASTERRGSLPCVS